MATFDQLPSGVYASSGKTNNWGQLLSAYLLWTFTQQYLPEVYEKEVERFGKRTVSGFLRMVGAEMPMASDRVVWSEQGRLHAAFTVNVDVSANN